jgi:hypothetical protein
LVFDERVHHGGALGGELVSAQAEDEEDVFDDDGEDFED